MMEENGNETGGDVQATVATGGRMPKWAKVVIAVTACVLAVALVAGAVLAATGLGGSDEVKGRRVSGYGTCDGDCKDGAGECDGECKGGAGDCGEKNGNCDGECSGEGAGVQRSGGGCGMGQGRGQQGCDGSCTVQSAPAQ